MNWQIIWRAERRAAPKPERSPSGDRQMYTSTEARHASIFQLLEQVQ